MRPAPSGRDLRYIQVSNVATFADLGDTCTMLDWSEVTPRQDHVIAAMDAWYGCRVAGARDG